MYKYYYYLNIVIKSYIYEYVVQYNIDVKIFVNKNVVTLIMKNHNWDSNFHSKSKILNDLVKFQIFLLTTRENLQEVKEEK